MSASSKSFSLKIRTMFIALGLNGLLAVDENRDLHYSI
jgi:hypothetical protein